MLGEERGVGGSDEKVERKSQRADGRFKKTENRVDDGPNAAAVEASDERTRDAVVRVHGVENLGFMKKK